MVSVRKKIIKQVLFTLAMIVVMYIAYLNKDDFFKMFHRIDHEETGSEFLRLLRGEFYWFYVGTRSLKPEQVREKFKEKREFWIKNSGPDLKNSFLILINEI
ncbi:hypothetical protein LCGC14_0718700 [marine sediment metagenome]|uniref:Uncharacterized protein n=1 Tax=marine sediment metagenome TaxID=412755 RepID=A0A0F9QD45_9ZZZZ